MSLNGINALKELDEFISEREAQNLEFSDKEKYVVDVLRRDATQAALNQLDTRVFNEFDRLKLVELEYMYQVRGIRQVMPSAIFREGYAGYGNSWTGSTIRLLYPQDRKRGGRMSREPLLPIDKIRETANLTEQLVPLRINLSTDKHRLKDRVLWNADDTTIPLELFVEIMLEDYGLPLSLAPDVSRSLQEQISNHLPHIYPVPPELREKENDQKDDKPKKEEKEEEKEEKEEKEVGKEEEKEKEKEEEKDESNTMDVDTESGNPAAEAETPAVESAVESEKPSTESETPAVEPATESEKPCTESKKPAESENPESENPESKKPSTESENPTTETVAAVKPDPIDDAPYDEDMRFTIKLDITIGHHQLIDQFEWDINNAENDPELFGVVMANELSLPLEFSTAISHGIREQVQSYTKSLYNSGYQFDGKLPRDQQLQNELAMPVNENQFLRRPELIEDYTPKLKDSNLTGLDPTQHEQEVERRELRSRRRMGRSSRRGNHDNRSGNGTNGQSDVMFLKQETRGPDFCTPLFSSALPGGLDRNLSILYMTVYQNDEAYGGDKQDLVYYFHKHRREKKVPSVSQFERSLVLPDKPRWVVKLRIPKRTN